MKLAFALLLAAFWSAPATAECLDISAKQVTLTGTVTRDVFPGAPNFEDVASGDTPEPTYILHLPAKICTKGGDPEFGNPETDTVHLAFYEADWPLLRSHIGRRITVTGETIAAITGHHHAPLVMFISKATEPAP